MRKLNNINQSSLIRKVTVLVSKLKENCFSNAGTGWFHLNKQFKYQEKYSKKLIQAALLL